MPGRESLDKTGQSPRTPGRLRGGKIQSDIQARRGRSDHKAQPPPPGVIGITQTCPLASDSDRMNCEPERARRDHRAVGSHAANARLSAAPGRIRRGTHSNSTVPKESEGTP